MDLLQNIQEIYFIKLITILKLSLPNLSDYKLYHAVREKNLDLKPVEPIFINFIN